MTSEGRGFNNIASFGLRPERFQGRNKSLACPKALALAVKDPQCQPSSNGVDNTTHSHHLTGKAASLHRDRHAINAAGVTYLSALNSRIESGLALAI